MKDDPLTGNVFIDERLDQLTIYGIRYSAEIFRGLGFRTRPGESFEIVERQDGGGMIMRTTYGVEWTRLVPGNPGTFPDETREILFTLNINEPKDRAKAGSFVGGWDAEDGVFHGLESRMVEPAEVGEWRYFPLPDIDYPTEPLEPVG